MMTTSALRRRAKEARLWLFESCFPLWAEHGLTDAGLFPEVLSLQHDELARDVTLHASACRKKKKKKEEEKREDGRWEEGTQGVLAARNPK